MRSEQSDCNTAEILATGIEMEETTMNVINPKKISTNKILLKTINFQKAFH